MLRKRILQITKKGTRLSDLLYLRNTVQFKTVTSINKAQTQQLGRTNISFSFSQSPHSKDDNSKHNLKKQAQSRTQNEEVQTIQVSYEEFKKMKELLQQLKSQISVLQQEGTPSTSEQSSLSPSPNSSIHNNSQHLKAKLTEFTKKSASLEQQNKQQQELFFNSLQQQLSFELIKLNSKQQFTQLVDIYSKRFMALKNSLKEQQSAQKRKEFLQHLKLLYLILFRYSSLENARFDDFLIRKLVLEVSCHIDMFEQSQVQKFISILNDQSKSMTDQHTHNQFVKSQKSTDQLVSHIRQNLLKDNKVFNYKSKTDMNSQVLSLISSFVFVDQRVHDKIHINCIDLKTHFKTGSNPEGQVAILYNPLNLSNLLMNSIKFNQSEQIKLKLYSLLVQSLKITQKQFQSQQITDKPLKLQQSLQSITPQSFRQIQYQALIHFFDHIPWIYSKTLRNISEQDFLNQLMKTQNFIQRFSLIQQLRICYALMTHPLAVHLQAKYHSTVLSQLERILLSNQSQTRLLEVHKYQYNMIESDDNYEFMYYKKTVMILSQIGIQFYKNYKIAPQPSKTPVILSKLNNLIRQILKFMNLICLEKAELQDMWKQDAENKDKQVEKLILNLSAFEFIVNFNILSKWTVQLSGDPNVQENNNELLKSLVNCYLVGLKKNLANFKMLSKQRKLQLADEFLIIILIGKQHSVIRKSIDFCLTESDQSTAYTTLLKQTIGKDQSHKYFQQYTKICQQFKI